MQSCGMSIIKYLLFAFNSLFAISGIAIIAVGSVAVSHSSDLEHLDDGNLVGPAIVLIITGTIVFVIAFLGCFGAIRESYCMLMTFAVFLLIIFIVELAVGIAVAANKSELKKEKVKASLDNYSAKKEDQVFWDRIQSSLECCGVNGPKDWGTSIPYSCCKSTVENGKSEEDPFCSTSKEGKKYLSSVGCLEKLQMGVKTYSHALIGVGIGIAFVEVVGIVLACWLAAVIKRENDSGPKSAAK